MNKPSTDSKILCLHHGPFLAGAMVVLSILLNWGPETAEARFEKSQEPPSKPIEFHPPTTHRVELPNGMILHMLEDHELPLIEMTALIWSGSVFEPPDKAGLASLTGTVMRTGGTGTMTGDEIDETLEFIAGFVSTSIGEESGQAGLSVLTKDLETGLKIFYEVLRFPEFDPGKLTISKNKMIESIRRQNDDPKDLAGRELTQRIYPDSPYGRYPTIESVQSLTRQDCIEFHKRFFHPNRIIIGISGDFKVEEMTERIQTLFSDWPPTPDKPLELPDLASDRKINGQSVVFAEKSIPQTVIRMGHLGIKRTNPDFYAVQVMNYILGGSGFTSRLVKEIRSDRGLAYSVWSYFSMGHGAPGAFRAGLETKGETTLLSIHLMKQIIDSMKTDLVDETELSTAKNALIHSFVFSFDSSSEVVRHRATIEYFDLPRDTLEVYREKIAEVTRRDVQRVSEKYLHPDQSIILVVGDQKRFDKPLSELGEVEVIPPE